MKTSCRILHWAGLIFVSIFLTGKIHAQQIMAFSNSAALPSGGLQVNGPFALGLEFTVNSNVYVTQLGAYDSTIGGSGAGFGTSVQVGIYSEASQSFLPQTATFSGTVGTVVGSYRFQGIPALALPPGNYIVVAAGLGVPGTPLWNARIAGTTPSLIQLNTGGGTLTLGRSMYAMSSGSQLTPVIFTDMGPNPQYAAGSFMFSTSTNAFSTFTFTLDEPCKTSAGVYKPDGTLVRTLWSKVRYPAGTNSALWDGNDDNHSPVTAGTYQFRLLQHNTEYLWDGAIGNTSAEISGPTVHRGFWPMRGMSISGTNAFYVSGYNEGMYDFRNFLTTDPQHVKMSWYWVYSAQFNRVSSLPGDLNDLNWLWTTADSNRVYFACSSTPNPANPSVPNVYKGCVVSCNVGDNSPAYFSSGGQITNNGDHSPLPNGIYVGTQPGLSGLSVQQNGNLLAVSVAPDNKVYLMDKTSGAAIANFPVASPGRLNFSPDGSLWVVSSNKVICFTNESISASAALTLTGFSEPLDVAVNPTNSNIILVADGGSSQQVKAFNSSGTSLWTYGLAGGYQTNGVAVATNKFWFYNGEADGTFICFAPDGSFWVGDPGNYRSMHFSAARNYIEQIMYQPLSWVACVDQNNPTRVFNQFMEFKVDYSKPLSQGWTLVNNWKINVDAYHINGLLQGFFEVTTFPNGHTYALIDNLHYNPALSELCELSTNQLRLTGILPVSSTNRGWTSFGPDGSARRTTIGTATWFQSTLAGFNSSNNPVWYPETLLASASNGGSDPVPRCCSFGNIRATISSNNILISFDQSLNNQLTPAFHLGGIRVGGSNWLWKASPSPTSGYMDGSGTYEVSNNVVYAGNTLQAVDRNVIYGYHGEFFRGEGQACQTMHFYDDGLFVGQFGEATPGHSAYEGALPGTASNGHFPSLIKSTNGDYYLWVNDEGSHGPQRWHFVNARNIREQSGSGALGGTIVLTNPVYDFPTAVSGKSGNQSAELTWNPVPGATFYNIRYSLMNGGPYDLLAGCTTNTDFVAGGLTNGQACYFAVTAVKAGIEGTPSEQVTVYPFDTTQNVLTSGSMSEGGQFTPIADFSSAAVGTGQPSYLGTEQFTGLISPRELDYYGFGNLQNESVGTRGYNIYDWGGHGSNVVNIPAGFTFATGTGWADIDNLERQYRLGGTVGANSGYVANPLGSINIGVSDSNYHYLTVISPAQFNNPRQFNMRLTSTNNTSASFSIAESNGYSHVFQFLFRGNSTLWGDGTGGAGAIVQAFAFDDAAVTYATTASSNTTTAPVLTNVKLFSNGAIQFSFLNNPLATFTVLTTTNVSVPLTNWTVAGTATNAAPGVFQFTSQPATNVPRRFYLVRTP